MPPCCRLRKTLLRAGTRATARPFPPTRSQPLTQPPALCAPSVRPPRLHPQGHRESRIPCFQRDGIPDDQQLTNFPTKNETGVRYFDSAVTVWGPPQEIGLENFLNKKPFQFVCAPSARRVCLPTVTPS